LAAIALGGTLWSMRRPPSGSRSRFAASARRVAGSYSSRNTSAGINRAARSADADPREATRVHVDAPAARARPLRGPRRVVMMT